MRAATACGPTGLRGRAAFLGQREESVCDSLPRPPPPIGASNAYLIQPRQFRFLWPINLAVFVRTCIIIATGGFLALNPVILQGHFLARPLNELSMNEWFRARTDDFEQ